MATLKGIYVLAVLISRDKTVEIGSLGSVSFPRGMYAYVGSAQKNLEKRLKRHVEKTAKRKFWHIDYLLAENSTKVVKIYFKEAGKAEECFTAQTLAKFGFPVEGFGCSDCQCESHLFLFGGLSQMEDVCLKLGFKPFPLSCQRVAALGNI